MTLALAAVFPVFAKLQALEDITGGANGKPADDIIWTTPGWVPGSLSNPAWQFLVLSAIAAVLFVLASNMMKSRPGRNLVALRDSEVGAAVSGVWPTGWKTGAFAISAAYGAVGGSMLVFITRIAAPETGGFATAIALLTGAVLGGLGTISGAAVGALAVVFVPYYTNEFMAGDGFLFIPASDGPRDFLIFQGGDGPILAGALYGVLLIAVVFVMPGGIVYFVRLLRSKLIRFVPKLPDVSAPRRDEPSPAALEPAGAINQPRGENPHEKKEPRPLRRGRTCLRARRCCVRRRQRLRQRRDDGRRCSHDRCSCRDDRRRRGHDRSRRWRDLPSGHRQLPARGDDGAPGR